MKTPIRQAVVLFLAAGMISHAQPQPVPRAPIGDRVYPVGNGVTEPQVISKVDPSYSPEAVLLRFWGTGTVQVVVSPDGKARDFKILKPFGYALEQQAIDAIRVWRFEPGTKDGTPVAVYATIEVSFVSPPRRSDLWYSGPMTFNRAGGLTAPVVFNGTMPEANKKESDGPPRVRRSPQEPQDDGLNESVVLEFTVDSGGAARNIRAIHGPAWATMMLSRHLAKWQFHPAMKGGFPAEATGRILFVIGKGDGAEVALPPTADTTETVEPASSASVAAARISSVAFFGSPANPEIFIYGDGFGTPPEPSTAAPYGCTGSNYGTSLYLTDSTAPTQFEAGYDGSGKRDDMGLVVSDYRAGMITFTLGSHYSGTCGPANHYRLNEGDRFTIHVRNATIAGTVHFLGGTEGPATVAPSSRQTAASENDSPPRIAVNTPEGGKPAEVAVTGIVRRVNTKELLLQIDERTVLRFRLLQITPFLDQEGDPIRDSLLLPGDHLSIQASPDDLETATRVVFIVKGTAAERASARKPPAEETIRSPEPADFHHAGK